MATSRTLYLGTLNASSWALRAWLALKESGADFKEQLVDIRVPHRAANLAEIGKFSPPAAVPVLVDGAHVIFDSLAIMEFANELCSGRLLPRDPFQRARARSLTAWVHSGMSQLLCEVSFELSFTPFDPAQRAAQRHDMDRLLGILEAELKASEGPYLSGEAGLADFAFVPVVRRLLWLRPDLSAYPLAADWMAHLMARPWVRAWMSRAETLPPVIHG